MELEYKLKTCLEKKSTFHQKRIVHLNQVLTTMRNLNRLYRSIHCIESFIRDLCDLLVQTRGYHHAWIVLMSEDNKPPLISYAGIGEKGRSLQAAILSNYYPDCCQQALSELRLIVVADPLTDCRKCPFKGLYQKRGAFILPIKYEEKVFGLISVSMPPSLLSDTEERSLFQEIGNDIGFALYDFNLQSNRKQQEEKLIHSLKEKELLLQEIHHRVKNNLQIICSLLSLQGAQSKKKVVKKLFQKTRNRILSMSLIHEELYESDDFTEIDFFGYINQLVFNLYRSFKVDPNTVRVRVYAEEVILNIDMAVPCGLIINELISNALIYAFPASFKQDREIQVRLEQVQNDSLELVVKDNGAGLPEKFNLNKLKTLGLNIVSILVREQLNGAIQINRRDGTEYRIRYPLTKSKKRIS